MTVVVRSPEVIDAAQKLIDALKNLLAATGASRVKIDFRVGTREGEQFVMDHTYTFPKKRS